MNQDHDPDYETRLFEHVRAAILAASAPFDPDHEFRLEADGAMNALLMWVAAAAAMSGQADTPEQAAALCNGLASKLFAMIGAAKRLLAAGRKETLQ